MRSCVLITGASSGIGKAIAIRLADRYDLIVAGRNKIVLDNFAFEFKERCKIRVWCYDLSDVENLQSTFEAFVRDACCHITHFVHCAGIAAPCVLRAIDVKYVRNISETNAMSAMLLTGSLMKRNIAKESMKSILFISSASAGLGTSGSAVYGASKAMLDGFVKSAAVELAPKVRVNSIRPGFVKSKMTESILGCPEVLNAISRRHPLGIGSVEDIAATVDFLISDGARWITGQNIAVDGGVSCDMTFKKGEV